ncbi:MAG: sensor histidine kinase [Actinocrinis sp.]
MRVSTVPRPGLTATARPAGAARPRRPRQQAWPGELVNYVATALTALYRSRRGAFGDVLLLSISTLLFPGHPQTLAMAVVLPLALLATVPLAVARRFPALALSTVLAANGVFIVFGRLSWPIPAVAGWFYALGLCPILLPRRAAFTALGLCEAAVVCAALISSPRNNTPWDATAAEFLATVTAWGVGESLRARRSSAVERQAAAALVTELRERDAVARERSAIARELHDVVAHHVSLIAVRAATAPYGQPDLPPAARAAYEEIAEQARTALTELRTVLGVLRAGDAEVGQAPQPCLADVPELARRVRENGLDVSLGVSGRIRPLPESLELCGYRVVQESLTNAGRHASGSRARVGIEYCDDALLITVRDDGSGSAAHHGSKPRQGPRPEPQNGGYGLIGMRERVAVLDGSLEAGPDAAGGFTVAVRLPLRPAGNAEGRRA